VAEQICQQAGKNVLIARIGQLCGDTRGGYWNTSEAWPLMIKTAQEIGCLPSAGPVSVEKEDADRDLYINSTLPKPAT
jgi:thioester reductase-like protein